MEQTLLPENGLLGEMRLFEASGQLPSNLRQLHQALLTIPPTTVQAERSFSSSGNLVTKLRNRMSDETVEDILFLQGHYKK